MKKLISLVLLAIISSGCSTLHHPFYYKIEKDGSKSYALGTAHMGFEAKELPSAITEQLKKSRTFASEINTSWGDNLKKFTLRQARTQRQRFKNNLKTNYKLSDQFTEEEWSTIHAKLQSGIDQKLPEFAHLKESDFEKLTPFQCEAYVILVTKWLVYVDNDQAYGLRHGHLDFELFKMAENEGKVIFNLDSEVPYNEDCTDRIYIDQLKFIAKTGHLNTSEQVNLFFNAYKSGDEAAMDAYTKQSNDAAVDRCMLTERNERWAEIIDSHFASTSPIFIAVGAGNLVGEQNLLELLKKRGYDVMRIEEF